jgi:hypothetical protein
MNNEFSEDTEALERNLPMQVKIRGLYRITVTCNEFQGYKDVEMEVFRWNTENVPFNPAEYMPSCVTIPDEDTKNDILEYLRESFTMKEIKQITKYFSNIKAIPVRQYYPSYLPEDGRIFPTGKLPIPDETGYIVFKDKDKSLPFILGAYYDLRGRDHVHGSSGNKFAICPRCKAEVDELIITKNIIDGNLKHILNEIKKLSQESDENLPTIRNIEHRLFRKLRGVDPSIILNKLEKRIIKYLANTNPPVTTEMIAKEMKISWNAAQIHLFTLMTLGLTLYEEIEQQDQSEEPDSPAYG